MSKVPVSPQKRKQQYILGLIFSVMVIAVFGVMVFYQSFVWVPLPDEARPNLVFNGQIHDFPVVIEDGESYVPITFIRNEIDPDVFWDGSGPVVITTDDKVVKLKTDSLTGYVNQHPVDLEFPVILEGNEAYIPASSLEILYPLLPSYMEESRAFVVDKLDVGVTMGRLKNNTMMREEPSILARRVRELPSGSEVQLFQSVGSWIKAMSSNGFVGYIKTGDLTSTYEREPQVPVKREYVPQPLAGDKVCLVWEYVGIQTPDSRDIPEMPGLNVVSPTWFNLAPTPGEVSNRADMRYVNWAHSNGYQVWALFSNSFDLDLTRTILRDSDLRDKVISQILIFSEIYSLDGINIDFENVYREDAPYLTQFVREMVPLLHEQGLTVSMDVTMRSLSPTWSLCYERSRLAQVLDYMMLMAYDQYPANSSVSGPVSTIPWTEYAIETTLEEVPNEKLILGVPFYTRIWTEKVEEGKTTASSISVGMRYAQNWLQSRGVEAQYQPETGLKYAEVVSGTEIYKIWIEDADSMNSRTGLADEYGLAGVAAWRRGFELPEIWEVLKEYSSP